MSTENKPKLRPEVLAFAEAMERELRENDHKGGWEKCSSDYLIEKLLEEATEIIRSLGFTNLTDKWWIDFFELKLNGARPGNVLKESADTANIVMMLADNFGGLIKVKVSG